MLLLPVRTRRLENVKVEVDVVQPDDGNLSQHVQLRMLEPSPDLELALETEGQLRVALKRVKRELPAALLVQLADIGDVAVFDGHECSLPARRTDVDSDEAAIKRRHDDLRPVTRLLGRDWRALGRLNQTRHRPKA